MRKLISAFAIAALATLGGVCSSHAQPEGAFNAPSLDSPLPTANSAPPRSSTSEQSKADPIQPTASDTNEKFADPKPFIDGLMTGLITSGQMPGAAIVLIRNGQIILKAGYGRADIRNNLAVDPDKTRFRVASISKLVTATAVMQVVEQGKVDINADVNTYLDKFKIPATYPEPITLANVLTHTAGFDDKYLGLSAPVSAPAIPLSTYLAKSMPPRVLPPNRLIVYSNHGYSLAGHIVENASGQDFNAYVREHIFQPLQMTSTTFGAPFPVPPDIAVPYFKGGEERGYNRSELDRVNLGPAGDMITTASDVAQFMLMHLNRGGYGDGEHIISEQTVETMHAQHFSDREGLDGWAYGFEEGHRNGIRWIGHDGSWRGYCAQLVLHPETKSGFFVVYNVDCHFRVNAPIRKALFDVLWPHKSPQGETPLDAAERARTLVGTYMAMRRARNDVTLIAAAATQMTIKAEGAGKLLVLLPDVGHELEFLPQSNGTWINPEFSLKAAALGGPQGQWADFAIENSAFQRVTTTAEWAVWSTVLAIVIGVSVIALWMWLTGLARQYVTGTPSFSSGPLQRLVGAAAAIIVLVSLIAMSALLSESAPLAILHGPTPGLMVLLSSSVALALLVVPMMIWSVTGFGPEPRARLSQFGYIILTLAVLAVLAFAWQWNVHPLNFL